MSRAAEGGRPGRLLARGRAADVFDRGDGTVLRRYRGDHDVGPEARLMGWLHDQGYPVPKVHRAAGRDLVLDHVDGPTMLDDVARRPWMLPVHARTLARLQRRLVGFGAPSWLPVREGVPAGHVVLHLDLHPMNVLLGPDGPVVIDWTNTSRGDGRFDAAMTHVIMATSDVDTRLLRVGRRAMVFGFDRSRGRSAVRPLRAVACRYRLADPNVTDRERRALRSLAARG